MSHYEFSGDGGGSEVDHNRTVDVSSSSYTYGAGTTNYTQNYSYTSSIPTYQQRSTDHQYPHVKVPVTAPSITAPAITPSYSGILSKNGIFSSMSHTTKESMDLVDFDAEDLSLLEDYKRPLAGLSSYSDYNCDVPLPSSYKISAADSGRHSHSPITTSSRTPSRNSRTSAEDGFYSYGASYPSIPSAGSYYGQPTIHYAPDPSRNIIAPIPIPIKPEVEGEPVLGQSCPPLATVAPAPTPGKSEIEAELVAGSSKEYPFAIIGHLQKNPGDINNTVEGLRIVRRKPPQPILGSSTQERQVSCQTLFASTRDKGKMKEKDSSEDETIETVKPSVPPVKPLPKVPLTQFSAQPQIPLRLLTLEKGKSSCIVSSCRVPTNQGIRNDVQGPPRRWYFRETEEGVIGTSSRTPFSPVVIKPRGWKCLLDIGSTARGWYSMVFCISIKSSNRDQLDSITIDAIQLDQEKRPVYTAKTCKTVVRNEEFAAIIKGIPTRLKLHRQIEIQSEGWIEISINSSFADLSNCELYYVDLESGPFVSEGLVDLESALLDRILFGEGIPQQIISVGHASTILQNTISIHSIGISSAGKHAVTLCFDGGFAIVEVWALEGNGSEGSNVPLARITRPFARGTFRATFANHPDLRDICLSVSNSGQHVALHSNDSSHKGIPCHILKCNPHVTYNPASTSLVLNELTLPRGLKRFFGHGTFHSYESKSSGGLKERYIICDGIHVSVYNFAKDWTLESKIALGAESNPEAALGVMQSIRGQFIAWTGERGVVSIWDLESRSQISYIHVEGSNLGASASLSKDGSLIAISVKGRISIHETISGVKLGEYKGGLGEEKYFEVILEKDYFMLLDHNPPKDTDSDIVDRKIVRISDMSVVKTFPVHKDYMLESPSLLNYQALVYTQGSVANIMKIGSDVISAPETKPYDERSMIDISVENFSHSNSQEYTSSSGVVFSLVTSVSVIHGNWMTVLKITRKSNTEASGGDGVERSLEIPLGSSHALYSSIYMPKSSRLVIIIGRYLQIWKLLDGADSKHVAELELIWAFQVDDSKQRIVDICIRQVSSAVADSDGTNFAMILRPPQWFRRLKELPRNSANGNLETIAWPVSEIDTLSISEEYRVAHGIRGAVDMYIDGNDDCRRSVVQYLKTLVRPSPKNTISCIVTLCHYWSPEDRTYFEQMMSELLPADQITWVPNATDSSKDMTISRYGHEDPLAFLLKMAETQPAAIGVAKVIMDYCVNHANSSKNLTFLSPIFGSMREVMTLFPEEALECLSRIAFIPAKQRSYIIDNHIIVHPPKFRLQFWKPVQQQLCDTIDPIMQLHVTPTKPNASNDKFTHPVFMASFDALWSYHDVAHTPMDENVVAASKDKGTSTRIEITPAPALQSLEAAPSTPVRPSWLTTLYYMILYKLRFRSKMYVECYDFNLEFFENPAIAALIAYKW
ncbi:hypothetical protein BGX27_007621 [Mortierella sp. AM989]|nr:hypothetical protein BGX27_007621 [Mortierella sp. AM989]